VSTRNYKAEPIVIPSSGNDANMNANKSDSILFIVKEASEISKRKKNRSYFVASFFYLQRERERERERMNGRNLLTFSAIFKYKT